MAHVVDTPSVQELIEDIRFLSTSGPVLRNRYRREGKYSEAQWLKFYPTFTDFTVAAGLAQKALRQPEVNEIAGNQWNISLPRTTISTLDDLLEYCKVDLSIWEVKNYVINKWEVGAAVGEQPNKRIITQPLFQVKATLIRRPELVAARNELASLREEAKACARVPKPIIRTNRHSGNMLEISLNDAHFGKLAWSRETRGPDYDTRIAQKLFLESVEHLLDRAAGYEFDQILFVVGNDLIHSDDTQGRTTRGTFVDCDTRYYKTFEIVRETITLCIERFRKIAPVVVKMVQGNHDELSVWHLGDSLTALFRDYDDVMIDNEPTYRKYHQWGKCGLMLTHGDKGKRADFPLLFATEEPELFGSTKFREVHTGHFHQTRTEEFHGVRVRIIPSLSAADAWHSENGFTGQQRVAEAYLFNEEEGLLAQFYFNADA